MKCHHHCNPGGTAQVLSCMLLSGKCSPAMVAFHMPPFAGAQVSRQLPHLTVCPHPIWVHGTGSWRHCCRCIFLFSKEPFHVQLSTRFWQKVSRDCTRLSNTITLWRSVAWRGFRPTGQVCLLWTFTQVSTHVLQNKCPVLQETASHITCLLQLRKKKYKLASILCMLIYLIVS